MDQQDNLFTVIFTRNDQIPTKSNFEVSQSIEIDQDSVLNARTIRDGFLDSEILRIKVRVKYERGAPNEEVALLHPEMMIRPHITTNSDELDMFNEVEELDFLENDFISYNG